jgi:DNA repair protein RecN (Recombination protein N)
MLKKISIQNFAIIDELRVEFTGGFTAITGETGAGKSILLGALGLVLGNRAESIVLLNKEKKCTVEVLFQSHNTTIQQWLQQHELDEQDELIIRREISAAGKSRAFINDTPVNLSQLKELTLLLVDLHQQFDTLELGEAYFQREVVDALAGCTETVNNYHKDFLKLTSLQKELEELKQQQQKAKNEQDYKQFLLDELQEAAFKENELEQREQELKLLNNAGAISGTLNEAVKILKESDTPIVQQLKSLMNKLQVYKDVHPQLGSITERLQSAQIELSDISNELNHLQNEMTVDEEKIQLAEQRLTVGYKLQKKHNLHSTAELLQLQQQLEQEVALVFNAEQTIAAKEKIIEQLVQQLSKMADSIHEQRKKHSKLLEQKVNTLLHKVGMPNAAIKVEVNAGRLNAYGKDEISFLFDANKSRRFEPIYKVASGGELSRLMLCIKSLVAAHIQLPTMIFDEIDTGISGEAAKQVGILLKELSAKQQVITITHLPQIAAKASTHYYVYKQEENKAIHTKIRLLNKNEQVETIARMLSGENFTQSSLITAKEMVAGQ